MTMLDVISRSRLREEHATNNPTPPHRGQVLPDYGMKQPDGTPVMLSDFRGKQNLILIFLVGESAAIDGSQAQFLQALSRKSVEVRENETRVIVVTRPQQLQTVAALSQEFTAAADEAGTVFADVAAGSGTTIYITDKFREVVHVYRSATQEALPNISDILDWLRFVVMNCPECHPPEWPADALEP
jgi:peroxiredoxin